MWAKCGMTLTNMSALLDQFYYFLNAYIYKIVDAFHSLALLAPD